MVWSNRPTTLFGTWLGVATQCSYIRDSGKMESLGYFSAEEEAARAHDMRARQIGKAALNFDEDGATGAAAAVTWHVLRGGGLRHATSRQWIRRTQPMQRSCSGFGLGCGNTSCDVTTQ